MRFRIATLATALVVTPLAAVAHASSSYIADGRQARSGLRISARCTVPDEEIQAARDKAMRGATWIVVFDATPESTNVKSLRVVSLPTNTCDVVVSGLFTQIARMANDPDAQGDRGAASVDSVVAYLDANAPALRSASRRRWKSSAGEQVVVYVLREPTKQAKITFKETARQSRLATDLSALLALIPKLKSPSGAIGLVSRSGRSAYSVKTYAIQETRASLAIDASIVARKAASPSPVSESASVVNPDTSGATSGALASAAAPDGLNVTLTTGPAEYLFLSANAGTSTVKQVKYDQGTKSLTPAQTPKQFYLGANLAFGDLLEDSRASGLGGLVHALYVGFLLEGSSKPFNQVGGILGLRRLPILADVLTFDTVSPYAGVVWAKNEVLASGGSTGEVKGHLGRGHPIFGLSLNISKAADWLGGDKGSK